MQLQVQSTPFALRQAPGFSRGNAGQGQAHKLSLHRINSLRIKRRRSLRVRVQAMHPDAQRRRMESEERKRKTEERLRLQKLYGWWGVPGPKNVISVDNTTELKEVINQNKLVCIKYFQPNCAACKTMYPKFMKIAEQRQDVLFVKINVSNEQLKPIFEGQGIKHTPYFQLLLDSDIVYSFTANLNSVNDITKYIDKVSEEIKQSSEEADIVVMGPTQDEVNAYANTQVKPQPAMSV